MNRLLGIVLDVEYLYTCVHKEEDADTKQVYFSLFKVSTRPAPLTRCHVDLYVFTSCTDDPTLPAPPSALLVFHSQLLRKSILQMGKPMLETQENPPFEKPSIGQVIDVLQEKK